jgi:hypothetical protein
LVARRIDGPDGRHWVVAVVLGASNADGGWSSPFGGCRKGLGLVYTGSGRVLLGIKLHDGGIEALHVGLGLVAMGVEDLLVK